MNTKFKVGDKVRVIQMAGDDHANTQYFNVGDIGIVINPNVSAGHHGYIIDVDFRNQGNKELYLDGVWCVYCEDSLELVKEE